ncbi:MAG: DUF697 domain-containing protein [Myxococcales bacterium]|nr:DUF697 domain-containing protein [Myxococcales bacterium]
MTYAEVLERIMRGDYDDASAEERSQAVRMSIQACAVASAAVTIQPFPLVDTALLAPIQIGMVQAIGRIHGHRLDTKSVLEILSTLGASIVAQNAIMAAAKFVPFLGWVVTISMAYALTWAIGEVSDHYFSSGRGATSEELRERFKSVYRAKREEKQREHGSNDSLKSRLQQLKEAFEAGLIDEAEFDRKKQDLLSDF